MEFWKVFNELTIGICFGSFAVIYLFVIIKGLPETIATFKKELKK